MLWESQEIYRTVLEGIGEGYYEADLAGNFPFFNDPCAESMGTRERALMGMNDRQYTDEENGEKVFQSLNQVHRTRRERAEGRMAAWKNRYELLFTASGQLAYEYDVSTGDMSMGPLPRANIGIFPGRGAGKNCPMGGDDPSGGSGEGPSDVEDCGKISDTF